MSCSPLVCLLLEGCCSIHLSYGRDNHLGKFHGSPRLPQQCQLREHCSANWLSCRLEVTVEGDLQLAES